VIILSDSLYLVNYALVFYEYKTIAALGWGGSRSWRVKEKDFIFVEDVNELS